MRFHVVSPIAGCIALTFASLLVISRHNISNNIKLLFMIIFITYPYFAHLHYFYFQSAYNFIGLLLVVIGYRIIENSKNIFLYILSVVFLFIGITSYQANIAIYLNIVMINVILDYINDKNMKKALINILKGALVLLLTMILYYFSIKIFSGQMNGYHAGMIQYKKGLLYGLNKAGHTISDILFSRTELANMTANYLITIINCIFLLYIIFKSIKIKEYRFLFFLIFLWLLSIFSVHILIGDRLLMRSSISVAFYPSFTILLLLVLFKNIIIRIVLTMVSIYVILFHSYYIIRNHEAYVINYNMDVATTTILLEKLYNKVPELYYGTCNKIIFYGKIKKSTHPIRNGVTDFGISLFNISWNHNNSYMLDTLKLHGFPMNVQLGKITDEIKNVIDKMPSYPAEDCIKLYKDTVIVKLGDK